VNKMKKLLITCAGGSVLNSILPQIPSILFEIFLVDMDDEIAIKYLIKDNKLGVFNISFTKCPGGNDKNYKNWMSDFIERNEITHIIPLADEELKHIVELYNDKETCKCIEKICCSNNSQFVDNCVDKKRFVNISNVEKKWLKPKHFLIDELLISDFLRYNKIIAKPRFGRGSKKIYIFDNKNKLNIYSYVNLVNDDNYIFQEFVPGVEYTIFCYENIVVPKRIIKKRGITISAITEKNKIIENSCKAINLQLNPDGVFNVQGILTSDNKFYVFEINPRISTSTILTYNAGINEIMTGFDFLHKETFNENIKMHRYYQQIFTNEKGDLI
jgi:carbamoyl-phosphate synthase large subunit